VANGHLPDNREAALAMLQEAQGLLLSHDRDALRVAGDMPKKKKDALAILVHPEGAGEVRFSR
jgi:hypothetical protein